MATIKFKDSDILKEMSAKIDESSIAYGANGHYGIGAVYDVVDGEYINDEVISAQEESKALYDKVNEVDPNIPLGFFAE